MTTDSSEPVANRHNRMPVILEPINFNLWLDPQEQKVERLRDLLHPAAPDNADKIMSFFGPDFLAPKGTKEGKKTIATSPAA